MPEHFRALVVLLLLAGMVFFLARKPAGSLIGREDFARRRNLWLSLTIIAFFAHNFWIYILFAGLVLAFTRKQEPNPVGLYFMLLFVLSPAGMEIPGFGLINYFFTLSHQRLLVLVLLLPIFMLLPKRGGTHAFGSTLADKFLAAYLILVVILTLRETTFTDTLRQIFYQFIDVFLPYFVISRSLRERRSIREAISCLVLATLVLASVALFESIKHWHLYSAVEQVLEISSRLSGYDQRAGFLRASGPIDTIALGYVMAVGIGLYLYIQQFIKSTLVRNCGLALLLLGLIAALSRGPWLGAFVAYFIFVFTGRNPVTRLVKFTFVAILCLPLFVLLPGTEKLVDLLPYFGNVDQENVSYRTQLLENSLQVINRYPLFGSVDYLDTPEMQAMRQGQGIIDIVNSYIRIALESGYVGLLLFCGFFLSVGFGILRRLRHTGVADAEDRILGRALLFSLTAILVTIFTVSSISIIPTVYWSIAGVCAAYIHELDRRVFTEREISEPPTDIDHHRELS